MASAEILIVTEHHSKNGVAYQQSLLEEGNVLEV